MNTKIKRRDKKFTRALAVANKVTELTGQDIFSNSRKHAVIDARSLLNYLLYNNLDFTLHEIKEFYENEGKSYDHATALHSLNNFAVYRRSNPNMDSWLLQLSAEYTTVKAKINMLVQNIMTLQENDVDVLLDISKRMYDKHESLESAKIVK
jgi:chromosomal replication initiation ATPase DnaA